MFSKWRQDDKNSSSDAGPDLAAKLRLEEQRIRQLEADVFDAKREREHLQLINKDLQGNIKYLEARLNSLQRQQEQLGKQVGDRSVVAADLRLAISELKRTLEERDMLIEQLQQDRAAHPPSDQELLKAFELQKEVLDSLKETLTCPMCYETLGKGQIVSMLCGHSFCEPCVEKWRTASIKSKLQIPQEAFPPGKMIAADCPECRQDSFGGRVKVYMLEEAVRVLGRYNPTAAFLPQPTSV